MVLFRESILGISMSIPQLPKSKDEEKLLIEAHIRALLRHGGADLTVHQRYFLAETMGFTFRGLFGMALTALCDVYESADRFARYAMKADLLAASTPTKLVRAFQYLEACPAEQHPIFR